MPGSRLTAETRKVAKGSESLNARKPAASAKSANAASRKTLAKNPKLRAEDIDASFEAACDGAGLAATEQRRLIYRALMGRADHPTAEAVYLAIRGSAPRLSLATVYRNLRLFAEAGIVDEVATGSSFARFDGNKRPHHHLICRKCGSVSDFYSESLDRFAPGKGSVEGFEIESAKMNLFGTCARCGKSQRKQP